MSNGVSPATEGSWNKRLKVAVEVGDCAEGFGEAAFRTSHLSSRPGRTFPSVRMKRCLLCREFLRFFHLKGSSCDCFWVSLERLNCLNLFNKKGVSVHKILFWVSDGQNACCLGFCDSGVRNWDRLFANFDHHHCCPDPLRTLTNLSRNRETSFSC